MPAWTNRAVYQLARNGTSTHTVDLTSTVGLVSGAPFTPVAGRLLVAVVGGAVASSTPTGWTLPAAGSAVNYTGLYVWYRTAAAGSETFTTTHNGADYAIVVAVYEFPVGASFVKSAASASVTVGGSNPNLTGLTGSNLVMAAKGKLNTGSADSDYTWTGTGSPVKDWVVTAYGGGTDGHVTSVAYVEGFTGTSWQPTGATTGGTSCEGLTFAVKVPAVSGVASGSTSVVSVTTAAPSARHMAAGAVSAVAGVSGSPRTQAPAAGEAAAVTASTGVGGVLHPASGLITSGSTVAGSVTVQQSATGSALVVSGVDGVAGTAGVGSAAGMVHAVSGVTGLASLVHRTGGGVAVLSVVSGNPVAVAAGGASGRVMAESATLGVGRTTHAATAVALALSGTASVPLVQHPLGGVLTVRSGFVGNPRVTTPHEPFPATLTLTCNLPVLTLSGTTGPTLTLTGNLPGLTLEATW